MDTNLLIDKIYSDNNYPGLSKLISLVQKNEPSISKQKIKKWYDSQLEIQLLHDKQKTNPSSGHITALLEDELWTIDIFDLSKYKAENNNFRYIFAAIDTFTRKAYCEPTQTKDSDTIGATLLSIILEHKHSPRVLLTDNDSAYGGKTFSCRRWVLTFAETFQIAPGAYNQTFRLVI